MFSFLSVAPGKPRAMTAASDRHIERYCVDSAIKVLLPIQSLWLQAFNRPCIEFPQPGLKLGPLPDHSFQAARTDTNMHSVPIRPISFIHVRKSIHLSQIASCSSSCQNRSSSSFLCNSSSVRTQSQLDSLDCVFPTTHPAFGQTPFLAHSHTVFA